MNRLKALFVVAILSLFVSAVSVGSSLELPELEELIIVDEMIIDNAEKRNELKNAVAGRNVKDINEMADEIELASFYHYLICFMKYEDEDSLSYVLGYKGKIKNLGVVLGDYYLAKAEKSNASKYYQKAFDFYLQDDSESHRPVYNNAILLYTGKVQSVNGHGYLDLFKKAIKLGSYNALQFSVANDLISFNEGVDTMSSRNSLINLLSLGAVYYDGISTDVDYTKSLKYFNRAYEQYKSKAAAFASAQIYNDELKDVANAKRYYEYAIELGHCEAKNSLGIILIDEGKIENALTLLNEGYLCGSLDAGFNLGILKLNDDSIEDGLELLAILSEKGYAKASYNLGIYYMIGKYTHKDLELSEKYLKIAQQQGHKNANKFLLKLKALE